MEADTSYTAICGGTGKCGKCKIRIVKGVHAPTSFDERCFSKEQLDIGMRLACKAYPLEPLTVELDFKGEAEFQVVTEYDVEKEEAAVDTQTEYGIAVDIGTTTLAMQLGNCENSFAAFKDLWRSNQKMIAVTYCKTPEEQAKLYDMLHSMAEQK